MSRTRFTIAIQTCALVGAIAAGTVAIHTAADEAAERGAARGDEATPSRIAAVTVHLDHALVTREADVAMTPGERRIVFKPLPAGIDPASVRVRGRGASGLVIRGVEVRRLHEEPPLEEDTAAIQGEIDDLTRRHTLLLERKKSLGVLRGFVSGLKAAAVETSSRDLLARGFATDDWERAFAFLSGHLDRLADEEQRVDHEYGALSRRLEAVRARLAETASRRAPQHFAAEILVSAKDGGTARLSVSYLVSGAAWRPLYDARLDAVPGRVTIDGLGQIAQSTGEDWTDVAVTLTTSQPLAGIDLPRLASVRLVDLARHRAQGGFVQIVDGASVSSEFIGTLPVLGSNYQDVLQLAPGVIDTDGDGNPNVHGARDVEVITGSGGRPLRERTAAPSPAILPAVEVPLAQAVARGDVAMVFALPGRLAIPSDGQPHQHLIASREVEARVEYHCVPAISPEVFVVARITLPEDLPLLPGRMAHFVDGDLVGRSTVVPRSGGEELTLSFGPEMRLRADRRDTLLKTGRRGRDEERDRKVVTSLRNHLGRPVTVHLSDRVPVSGDDRIDVLIDRDDTTAALPADPGEPGILRWDLSVPEAGRADVTLRYRIRAPAGMLPAEP